LTTSGLENESNHIIFPPAATGMQQASGYDGEKKEKEKSERWRAADVWTEGRMNVDVRYHGDGEAEGEAKRIKAA